MLKNGDVNQLYSQLVVCQYRMWVYQMIDNTLLGQKFFLLRVVQPFPVYVLHVPTIPTISNNHGIVNKSQGLMITITDNNSQRAGCHQKSWSWWSGVHGVCNQFCFCGFLRVLGAFFRAIYWTCLFWMRLNWLYKNACFYNVRAIGPPPFVPPSDLLMNVSWATVRKFIHLLPIFLVTCASQEWICRQ